MEAVGESDPTYAGLQDALKKAKAQAQVRPDADRIASSKVFIERAKKRIAAGLEEVSLAQEALTMAQAKLQSEEYGLAEAEARLATLLIEESNGEAVPPPTVPADFAQELAELRASVQPLHQENADLRSQLQTGTRCEERERKHPRNLSTPSLDLVPMHRASADRTMDMEQSLHATNGMSESSCRMETLIDNAEASLRSHRFNPLSS